jgi:transglutaminase-like putative cysteine protease
MAKSKSPAITALQTWWLLAAALIALLPLTPHVPPWLSAMALALLAGRALLNWTHRKLPARGWLILLTFAGSAGVLAQFKTLFGQNPGVALLILFLSLKPLEAHTRRDGLAVIFLCYFLVLAQFFFAQSIATAGLMLATIVTVTAALGSLADGRARPADLLRRSGLMLLQAAPFMLLLFVLFPRVQGPLWGLPRDAFSALTGLSDSMAPGSISNLSQSDAIAFRAKLDQTLARDQLYWRGPVLSEFDGRTWRPEQRLLLPRLPYAPQGPAITYEVTLEPHAKAWLFALELPGGLPPDSQMTGDYQLLAKAPVTTRQRYTVSSHTAMTAGRDESAGILRRALALPRDFNPRTRELARGWRDNLKTDEAVLEAASRFFLTQGLRYSLTPPLLGQHGIDEFLFDTREGFCEHFSGAFVFALRAAGLPARVVTGYQGGEINPFDGYFTVRQYDAHAWAEVWLKDRGWVRIDPTALSVPSRIEQNLAAAVPAGSNVPFMARLDLSLLREVRLRLDAVANTWNQWVIGYNPERQREFLNRLGMRAPDWRQMTATMAVLAGMVLLGLTAWALRQRRHTDAVQRIWLRLCRKLERRGLPRAPWEGPLAYAARIAARFPESATEIRAISTLYGHLRYGTLDPVLLDELKTRVTRFQP